jgi:hypothetical protein
MHCGYALRIHKSHNLYYLQCETRYISRSACPGAFIPEAELEGIAADEIRKLNQKLLDMGALERNVQFEYVMKSKRGKLLSEKKRYLEKIDEYTIALQQLYTDKVANVISSKDYMELYSSFQVDKAKYEGLLLSCDGRIQEIDAHMKIGDRRAELLEPYVRVEHMPRRIVEALIERIEVGKRDPTTGAVPVTIYWSF